jgi:hypothetical protein
VGPRLEKVGWGFHGFLLASGCSFWLLGVLSAEVDGAQDDTYRGCHAVWLYLAAKPSHAGVDVDRLACPMREPMVYTCQMRGHGLLLGVVSSCLVLSCCYSGWCDLLGDVKLPEHRYLMKS